jgi:spermidine/putrescine transport system permease protein
VSGRRPVRQPGQLAAWAAWPGLLTSVLLTGGPLVVVAIFSFLAQPDFGGGVVWTATTKAYEHFFVDTDFLGNSSFNIAYLRVFALSFALAGITTAACLVMGFPLALWMANQSPRVQNVLVLLVTIPFWTNLLVRTYAWLLVLNENGVVNAALARTPIGKLDLLYTPFASAVGLVYTFLPFMVLPVYALLERFDFRLAEAAYDLGATRGIVLRRVIYPAARPGIVAGVFLVFVPALGSYVQPALLGGGKSLLVGNLIAAQYGDARNWPFGSALSMLLLLVLLVVLLAVLAWSRRTGTRVEIAA